MESLKEFSANEIRENAVLNEGGFSTLYDATLLQNKDHVVVKKIRKDITEPDEIDTFINEFEILSTMDNQFIIKPIGFIKGSPNSIVLPFYSNGTVYSEFKDDSKVLDGTEKTIAAIAISDALSYLHEKDIIHLDLNTGNLLFDEDYVPILIDFGIAQKSSNAKKTVFGTPEFMAPELYRDENPTVKADIYSFGIVLWSMLTGQYPFEDKNEAGIFVDVVRNGLRPYIPDDTPKPLRDLIRACWSSDPETRPTAEEIYSKFRSGKVEFPDTSRQEIEEFAQLHNLPERSYTFNRRNVPRMDKTAPSFPLSTLKDLKGNQLRMALKKALVMVSPEQAPEFFEVLRPTLEKWDVDGIEEAVWAVMSLLVIGEPFQNAFKESNLSSKIRINSRAADSALTLVAYIFQLIPSAVTEELIEKINDIFKVDSTKALTLINSYLCAKPMLPLFDMVMKLLVKESHDLIKQGKSEQLSSVLYTVYKNQRAVDSQYKNEVSSIISQVIYESESQTALAFAATENLPIELSTEIICKLLQSPLREPLAALMASEAKWTPNEQIIRLLIDLAKTTKIGGACILKICSTEEGVGLVASMAHSWIELQLPEAEDTVVIAMSALRFPKPRAIMSAPNILKPFVQALISTENIRYVQLVLEAVGVNEKNASVLQTLAFPYYKAVADSQDGALVVGSLKVLEMVISADPSVDMSGALVLIDELIKTRVDEWSRYVITALMTIACSPDARQRVATSGYISKISGWGSMNGNEVLYQHLLSVVAPQ